MMIKMIDWAEKACRAIATIAISIALAVGFAIGYFAPDASAKPATPEAAEYDVQGDDYQVNIRSERSDAPIGSPDLNRDIQSNIQDAIDNVREKLNLDQPLYPGTKEVIEDVREGVSDAVESTQDVLTGQP
ncbi:hypothetical protein H6F67_24080 [Microcoleus sp. FACHB-1515]|uniref:hypothetical protein n=1 Tax=Cyanophyceae TaxID=3028117 RepID=UPI00168459AA|nr:hypothetical protein [Microcoleus sp. FACHB-1515]MBD2092931.1 hypothetical protein [Microcoleus sp. FACHB-1515]